MTVGILPRLSVVLCCLALPFQHPSWSFVHVRVHTCTYMYVAFCLIHTHLEKNCIVCKELRQVAISQGSDEDQVFLDIRVLSL